MTDTRWEKFWRLAVHNDELIAEFDRLRGTNLQRRGTALELAIDGESGRLMGDVAAFWDFLKDLYARLPPMRVIVGGTRAASPLLFEAIKKRLAQLPAGSIVVHGAHDNHWSVDQMAHRAAIELGLQVEPHPADWEHFKKIGNPRAAGPVRNRGMVKKGADLCIVWWFDEEHADVTPGSRDLLKQAGKAEIPLEKRHAVTDLLLP